MALRECVTRTIMPKPPALPPILSIRGHRVMLDSDLARLYGVSTKVFNQTIQRNLTRFPIDFAFQLGRQDLANLRSQIVTSSSTVPRPQAIALPRHGGRRYRPFVFTEHGAIMAATILRSARAVAMSVYVVRAFVQMKEALLANAVILKRLAEIEKKLVTHDVVLRDVYEKLRPLLAPPPETPRKELGFHVTLPRPPAPKTGKKSATEAH